MKPPLAELRYGVGSGYEPPKMSELPKVAGQSCCGAGVGAELAGLQRLPPGVDRRAVGRVARVVPDGRAVGARRGGVDVVAEELAGQRVRARAARIAGRAAVQLRERAGRVPGLAELSACLTTPTSARGSVVFGLVRRRERVVDDVDVACRSARSPARRRSRGRRQSRSPAGSTRSRRGPSTR